MNNLKFGEQRTMKVQTVVRGVHFTGKGQYIHKITFTDPAGGVYVAEEPSDTPDCSFNQNETVTFQVTAPGRDGKADWIKFLGVSTNGAMPVSRDKVYVAQQAMLAAATLGASKGWTEDEVKSCARGLAKDIYEIANDL